MWKRWGKRGWRVAGAISSKAGGGGSGDKRPPRPPQEAPSQASWFGNKRVGVHPFNSGTGHTTGVSRIS